MSLIDEMLNEAKGGQDWVSLLELYLEKEMYRLIRDALENSGGAGHYRKLLAILNSEGFLERVQKIVSDSVPKAIERVKEEQEEQKMYY